MLPRTTGDFPFDTEPTFGRPAVRNTASSDSSEPYSRTIRACPRSAATPPEATSTGVGSSVEGSAILFARVSNCASVALTILVLLPVTTELIRQLHRMKHDRLAAIGVNVNQNFDFSRRLRVWMSDIQPDSTAINSFARQDC